MTDNTNNKRYSVEEQLQQQGAAPRVPVHNMEQNIVDPTPTKSNNNSNNLNRSKTVRANLGSAGSKMRGLFGGGGNKNKKEKERRMTTSATDENGFMTRPILSSSVSYGPGSEFQQAQNTIKEQQQENMYSEQTAADVEAIKLQQQQQQQQQQGTSSPNTNVTTSPTDEEQQLQAQQAQAQQAQAQQQQQFQMQQQQQQQQMMQQQQMNFQHELEQLNKLIETRQAEVVKEKQTKERLQMELNEAQRIFKEREVEYSAIEHSFFEHTRVIRATDDDLSTIRDSFKLLKYSIARLIMTLNKKADKQRAANKFIATWPQLTIVDPATGEMEPSFVNLLSEKLVHEHLVRSVFSAPIYPGLKVNDAYDALNKWLQAHQSYFSIRLRQQMAAVVAKSKNVENSEIQLSANKEKIKIAALIYEDLAEIYHPFLKENDASVEQEEKRYYNKICDIVDKAMKLTIAIRGQEVEITTVAIEEGNQQPFEEETMTEAKGRNNGLVRFCICPTFMGGDREHGFLEKGKVVISG